jgi:hypothetical protein
MASSTGALLCLRTHPIAQFEVEGQWGEHSEAGWMPEEIAYALIVRLALDYLALPEAA